MSRARVSLLRRTIAVAICAATALALLLCPDPVSAQGKTAKLPRPLILVPGLLGSRLCRPDPGDPKQTQVVWGTLSALLQFPTIRLSRDDANDSIRPCGIVREIVFLGLYSQDIYAPVIRHLEQTGYRENRDLLIFDYDWRRSVFDNAVALERFVREKVPEGKVDILAHSMGALVARVYVMQGGGSERVARLFSAGAPFQGSVKVFQTVEKGWGALNPAMGGLDGFRRTILSFPSVFELMPRYGGCCDAGGVAAFNASKIRTWKALNWEGVDPDTMPDLGTTFARIRTLESMVVRPMPKGVEDVLLVGVDQRTPQRAGFNGESRIAVLKIQTTWAGDGTVTRDSAVLERTPLHPTSFADHQRILHDPQIQAFLRVALIKGVDQALASVPVRPRGKVRTAAGSLSELVGVVVEPDEPIYKTGDICKVRVHLRLGDITKFDPASIKLTRRMMDGREVPIALSPDPDSSDPTNPFEQSFVGTFEAGVTPGKGMLKAVLQIAGSKPRVVEQPVPVIAR